MWNSCHSSKRHDNDCDDNGRDRRDDCDDRGRYGDHGHDRHHSGGGWGHDWRGGSDCDPGWGDHNGGHHGGGHHGGSDCHSLTLSICH